MHALVALDLHVEAEPFSERLARLAPENLTAAQRHLVAELLAHHAERMRHLLSQLDTERRGPDPESAVVAVDALARECRLVLVRALSIYRRK